MITPDETGTSQREAFGFDSLAEAPAVLVAYAPAKAVGKLRRHDLSFSRRKISKMLDALNLGRVKKSKT